MCRRLHLPIPGPLSLSASGSRRGQTLDEAASNLEAPRSGGGRVRGETEWQEKQSQAEASMPCGIRSFTHVLGA